MNENRRIFWNIVATYGRSLYALVIGLFAARWCLKALGVTDYGLLGVIGGITVFIDFLNNTLAAANARFYAVSIGRARAAQDKSAALEECRRWFNTALSIHAVVPAVLVLLGYPAGVWAIERFLTIPPDRVADCIWVFRFSCITCFVGMLNVPFSAMYNAHQYIAELTVYSYAKTTLNVLFVYFMVTHPGLWFVRYSLFTCAIAVVPHLLICIRAFCIFPECRVRSAYMYDFARIREVGSFALWNLLGTFCALLRVQGTNILVNKVFGPQVNAANALGMQVESQSSSLAAALMVAFLPAITVAYGEGRMDRMKAFAFRACRFGCLLLLVFIVPLIAELPEVLRIWLGTPPRYTAFLCMCALVMNFIDVSTQGHVVAVNASGRIREYQLNMVVISILTLPAAIVTVLLGGGVHALGIVLICARLGISLRRVYYARRFAGLSAAVWWKSVVVPLSLATAASAALAIVPHAFMAPSLARVCVTTLFAESALLPLSWFVILSDDERAFLLEKLSRLRHRLHPAP